MCELHKTAVLQLCTITIVAFIGLILLINSRIYDIISRASTKLLGVIPYDEAMSRAQEDGRLSFQVKNGHIPFCRAIENIAARCDGEDVLLLDGVKTGKNRSKII